MSEFRSFRNSASVRVKNKLKRIQLRARKVKKEGVAIVNFGMNKRCSNSLSSSIVKSTSDSAKIPNGEEARFRFRILEHYKHIINSTKLVCQFCQFQVT